MKLTANQQFILKTIAVHSDGVERGIYIRDITHPEDIKINDFNDEVIISFSGMAPVAVRGIIHSLETKGLIFKMNRRRNNGRTQLYFTQSGYNLIKEYFPPL